MDTDTVDQAYAQLQTEFQDAANSVQALAQKLQAAEQAGNTDAREWLLDLKQVALDIQAEQVQANALLQAIHQLVTNAVQAAPQTAPAPQQQPQQPLGFTGGGMGMGMLGNFLGGGFGRAMEMGAGIGLGQDLISSIFR